MTVQDVIDQMDAAEAEAQGQLAEVDRELVHTLRVEPTWPNKDAFAVYRQGQEAEAAVKRQKIEDALDAKLRRLRADGRDALAIERKMAEAAEYAAQFADAPQGAEEWAEANARAPFVQEDIRKTPPLKMPERYQLCVTAKDRVGAFLWRRYAPEYLEKEIMERTKQGVDALELYMALSEFRDATKAIIGPKHAAEAKRLDRLAQEIERLRTRTDKERLAAKYGIKIYPRA